MSQLFQRKPIGKLVVDEADSARWLKRVLGAGGLVMTNVLEVLRVNARERSGF